jgi:putative nucleotidyltransferase with HDIG domain
MLASLIAQAKAYERAGEWDRALADYEQAFARLTAEGDAVQGADLLRWIGTVRRERGDLELATEAYETSLRIAEANDLRPQVAAAWNCLGIVEHLRGEIDRAREFYIRTRELAEALNDPGLAAMVHLNLGALANIRGEMEEALARYSAALECYRGMGDDLNAARALNNLGKAHSEIGDREAADSCFREASGLVEATGDMHLLGTIELNRAELHLREQNYEEVRECCTRSLKTFSQMRAKNAVGEAYKLFGILYRETGKPEQAGTHLAMALGLAEAGEDRLLQAETQIEWAVLHLEEGREQDGITYLNRALRLFGEMQARREVLDIQRRLEKMEGLYLPAVKRWSASMCDKDPHQVGHLERVAEHSYELGKASGLSEWELTVLRVGALLHDVGKTILPRESQREYTSPRLEADTLSRIHTIAGDAITRQLDFPREVQLIVRHHHEHFAGTGYPDNLRSEWIPLGARIVCVVNAFDALTRPRGSRAPLSQREALNVMERDAGRIYDPELLARFRELLGPAVTGVVAA